MIFQNSSKLFFISDTHFFHKNIIKLCDRPFKDVDDMNNTIIHNWNNIIPKDGIVFHLGDFSYRGDLKAIKQLIPKLNGKIHLIFGNHDNKIKSNDCLKLFTSYAPMREIMIIEKDRSYMLTLCHYEMKSWNQKHRGSWHLFGHYHIKSPEYKDENSLSTLVNLEFNNYNPFPFSQIKEIITTKEGNYERR